MPFGSIPITPVVIDVPALVEVLIAWIVLTSSPKLPTYAFGTSAPEGFTSVKLVATPVLPTEE